MGSDNGRVCARGHAMTDENTYRAPGSVSTECRICRRARKAAYKKRQREAQAERDRLRAEEERVRGDIASAVGGE